MSIRTEIVNTIIDNLKKIDGHSSPYDSSYTFNSNLHTNVYRGFLYLPEINDFPSIYIVCDSETRQYNTAGLTEGEVSSIIRVYTYSDEAPDVETNNIIKDIEHVLYNMSYPLHLKIQDMVINKIVIDSGLLQPYGMAEVYLTINYVR